MRKYPIGIQTFSEIREGGYVYVDKTEYVWRLVEEGQYYFLSRPRRFGKSLLISTLEAFFKGRRSLFKNLAIDSKDYDWPEYPVLHIDLNSQDYTSDDDSLARMLDNTLKEWEQEYGLVPEHKDASLRFANIIKRVYHVTGRKVVILIDEYDKPLLTNLYETERADKFRNTLKAFYGVLKSCDQYIRFGFLTGVTKFGKVSVFSDLNNLRDISLLPAYNAICGITEIELRHVFAREIENLSEALGQHHDETAVQLRKHYDGYHFSEDVGIGIYNPFSILNVFINLRFNDYWFQTGTPTLLVRLLKRTGTELSTISGAERSENELMGLEPAFRDPVPIIFQSGYLTIKSYDARRKRYRLGFPNEEVERGFLEVLLPAYVGKKVSRDEADVFRLLDALEAGKIDLYMEILQSFMAGIPYSQESARIPERRFEDIMFIVSRLIGINAEAEHYTNRGRIDLLIKTKDYIYIMEFKVDKSPEEALAQIDERGYEMKFINDGRTIVKVGAEFSTKIRNISSWKTLFIDRPEK